MEKKINNVTANSVNVPLEIEKHKAQSLVHFEKWQESEKKWDELKKFVKLKRTINPSNTQYLKIMNFIEYLEEDTE